MKMFKQFFALAMICAALTTLTACNTMKGAGKDVERGGEKMQDATR
jgi:predicted small secreted protein